MCCSRYSCKMPDINTFRHALPSYAARLLSRQLYVRLYLSPSDGSVNNTITNNIGHSLVLLSEFTPRSPAIFAVSSYTRPPYILTRKLGFLTNGKHFLYPKGTDDLSEKGPFPN